MRVPQYTTCNVTGTVTPLMNWNGSVGGIFAVMCRDAATITGSINARGNNGTARLLYEGQNVAGASVPDLLAGQDVLMPPVMSEVGLEKAIRVAQFRRRTANGNGGRGAAPFKRQLMQAAGGGGHASAGGRDRRRVNLSAVRAGATTCR